MGRQLRISGPLYTEINLEIARKGSGKKLDNRGAHGRRQRWRG